VGWNTSMVDKAFLILGLKILNFKYSFLFKLPGVRQLENT
jgi:hypothetical protein